MICPSCKNEQDSGKFCGSCGATLITTTAEHEVSATSESAATIPAESSTTNENIEKAKVVSRQYGNYALSLLKNPAQAFQMGEQQFVNGIITVIIYALTFALSVYFLANNLFKAVMGGMESFFGETGPSTSLPFFDITFKLLLIGLVFVAIGILTTFLVVKLMGTQPTFKALFSKYSGLMIPFAALNLAAIVFGLTGSMKGTLIMLGVSLSFVIYLIPGYLAFEYAKNINHKIDRFYWSVGTILVTTLIMYMITQMFVADYIDSLRGMLENDFMDF